MDPQFDVLERKAQELANSPFANSIDQHSSEIILIASVVLVVFVLWKVMQLGLFAAKVAMILLAGAFIVRYIIPWETLIKVTSGLATFGLQPYRLAQAWREGSGAYGALQATVILGVWTVCNSAILALVAFLRNGDAENVKAAALWGVVITFAVFGLGLAL
jgi:hypothetical protein